MIIENYTLREFLKQPSELIGKYIVALQYLKPLKTKNEVFHLTLENVEFIKKNLFSDNDETLIEIISIVQGIKKHVVQNIKIIKFFSLVASVRQQIELINKAEETSLSSSIVNIRWEMVQGAERIAKFGIYNTLEKLSGGDILKYKKIMQTEYSEIFTVLYMRKTLAELDKEMNDIKLNQ